MDIACPQCSTSYSLDPRLIPSTGTSVRCSRCGHAFTAHSAPVPEPQGLAPVDAGAAGVRSTTPAMGQVAAPGVDEPRSSTQVMGQVSVPGFDEPRSSTQVMGQISVPGFEEPRSSTQVMGQVAVPGFEEPRSSTQVMGQISVPGFDEPRSSTQVMGRVAVPGFDEPRSSTQVMGRVAVPGFDEPRSSTQVMGQVAVPGFEEPRSSTQVMGQVAVPGFEEPRSPTLIMGGVAPVLQPVGTTGSRSSLLDVPLHEDASSPPLVGFLDEPFAGARSPTPRMGIPGAERSNTLSFGPLSEDPGPSRPRMTAEMGLVLPLDPDDARAPASKGPKPLPMGMGSPVARVTREPSAKSGRTGWLLVGALLIAVVGFIGWKRLGADAAPSEAALVAHDEALRTLRRDDPAALEQAGERLKALAQQSPALLRARADLALVLALQLDDQKARADAAHAAQAGLRMQIEALERAKTPGDWQNRVNALRDELGVHDTLLAQIVVREGSLEQELKALLKALPAAQDQQAPEDRIAITRAHLFTEAVTGSSETLALLSRFQQEGGADAWQQVAYATYILNARGAQSAGLQQAIQGLSEVKAADTLWLRPYVLLARLSRSAGDAQSVRSNLDAVLTLNPAHGLAEDLKGLLPKE